MGAESSYRSDPAGVFASDVHRRVLGALPGPDAAPIDVDALLVRLDADQNTPVDAGGLGAVLDELSAAGLLSRDGGALRMTAAGLEKLTGPIANEPPPLEGTALNAALSADAQNQARDLVRIAEAAAERVQFAERELSDAKEASAAAEAAVYALGSPNA